MISAIAEYVKNRRNELGRHVLFLGSAVRTSPDELTIEQLLERMAITWAEEHGIELPEEEPGPVALLRMSEQVPSHLERCRRLRPLVEERRPSEAHTRLARMISEHYFPAIFTTDPTDLLQRALHNHHMEPDVDYHLLVAGAHSADEISWRSPADPRGHSQVCGVHDRRTTAGAAEVDATIGGIGSVIASRSDALDLRRLHGARSRLHSACAHEAQSFGSTASSPWMTRISSGAGWHGRRGVYRLQPG